MLNDKNTEGWNSIQYAAKSGNLDLFKFLVENKVDIKNKSDQTKKNCLHTACENGNLDICKYIIHVERKVPTLTNTLDTMLRRAEIPKFYGF